MKKRIVSLLVALTLTMSAFAATATPASAAWDWDGDEGCYWSWTPWSYALCWNDWW